MLTSAECDALVSDARPHLVPTRSSGGLRPARRMSRSTRCWSPVQRKMSRLLNLPLAHLEGLKVIHYTRGGFFKPHHDAFRNTHDELTGASRWPCVPGDYPNRAVSLLVYLNDVERGGSTYFPTLGVEVRPRKGMGLLFMPSYTNGQPDPRVVHEGRPCIDDKWLCTQWGWSCEYIERLDPASGFPRT